MYVYMYVYIHIYIYIYNSFGRVAEFLSSPSPVTAPAKQSQQQATGAPERCKCSCDFRLQHIVLRATAIGV